MRNRRDANTSPVQLETLRPIHIGNKCSAATEWPERQQATGKMRMCGRADLRILERVRVKIMHLD